MSDNKVYDSIMRSENKKYCVTVEDCTKYLLRVTLVSRYKTRKSLFEMKRIFVIMTCFIILCSCNADNNDLSPVLSETNLEEFYMYEIGYRTISAFEAREIMLSGDDYILLDVRTEEEYRENRIEGAVLIPDYEIAERAEAELPDKTAVILVYCRSGRRSANAAEELADMGYTNIYDFGGIIDWTYETISG